MHSSSSEKWVNFWYTIFMEEKEIVSWCVSNLSVYTTLQCSVVGGIERDGKGMDNERYEGGNAEEDEEYFGND